MRVLPYLRVSTEEQANSGAGLTAQLFAIKTEATTRGWTLLPVIKDAGHSAKDLNRPGIQSALEQLDHGDADVLVVAKLDRLSRSMLDFANLMDRAQKRGWGLVALDGGWSGRREAPGVARAWPTAAGLLPPPIEPCMRFSRTRLTDVLHRRHSAPWRHGRLGRGATMVPLRLIRP